MIYRRIDRADYEQVLALQEVNLFDNLSDEARRNGYLSARFSAEDFARMDQDVAVIVAADDATLAGYACASSVELSRKVPILSAMIDRFDELALHGVTLARLRVFVSGPVCVAQQYRGSGVLRGLHRTANAQAAARYDAGVGFVAKSNPRSHAAHVRGLGMQSIGEFRYNANAYWIIGFEVGN